MSEASFETICWRGVQLNHPPEWEVSIASGVHEPGRLTLVDRRYTRFDLQWKPVRYVPNMERMLDKFRQHKEDRKKDVTLQRLEGMEPWLGVLRKTGESIFVHAGKFFQAERLLFEASIVWPKQRKPMIDRAILDSIRPIDPSLPVKPWRALGLSLRLDSAMDLLNSDAKVGKVSWTFGPRKSGKERLIVERLAMVDKWLKQPVRQWLEEQLPQGSKVMLQDSSTVFNGHTSERLLSQRSAGTLSRLRGLRQMRLDVAWKCPKDQRLYHVATTVVARQGMIDLPKSLKIDCCIQAPAVGGTEL